MPGPPIIHRWDQRSALELEYDLRVAVDRRMQQRRERLFSQPRYASLRPPAPTAQEAASQTAHSSTIARPEIQWDPLVIRIPDGPHAARIVDEVIVSALYF